MSEYDEQLSAAKYKAERDLARQECKRLHGEVDKLVNDLIHAEYDADEHAWVREHGGLDEVCRRYRDSENRRVELCSALGIDAETGWSDAMAEMSRRLMPEGIEWPRYESGELVEIGDEVVGPDYGEHIRVDEITFHANGFTLREKTGLDHWYESDDRFERHAVLAADGEPLEAGQAVWHVADGKEYRVSELLKDGGAMVEAQGRPKGRCRADYLTHQRPVLDAEGSRIEPAMDVWWVCEGDERGIHTEKLHVEGIDEDGMVECSPYNGGTWVVLDSAELYVRKPVLDANGVPIKVGDTVWHKGTGGKYRVFRFSYEENRVWVKSDLGSFFLDCSMLTHTKPEPPDSWERIEEDAENIQCYADARAYVIDRGLMHINEETGDSMTLIAARDLVSRCKALAERGE